MKLQEVVPGRGESADRCLFAEAGMGPVPVVAMQPYGKLAASMVGVLVGAGVGPFSQRGLDEALGFSIGLRRVGPGPDRLDAEPFAGAGKCFRAIA